MSLEKPISTIRKALHGIAEENAFGNLKGTPEKKDFDDAINVLRSLKNSDPEKFELVVKVGAEGKELKDKIGEERYKLFMSIWEDLCINDFTNLNIACDLIEKTPMLVTDKHKAIHKLNENFYTKKLEEMKENTKLKAAFQGNEEIFNQALKVTASTAIKMFESEQKDKKLGFVKEKSQQSLYAKVLKYLRGLK